MADGLRPVARFGLRELLATFRRVFTERTGGLETPFRIFLLAYIAVAFLPTPALSVRRLHDVGRSGLWLLIYPVPIVGFFVLLYFFVIPGDPKRNRHGPPPLRASRPEPPSWIGNRRTRPWAIHGTGSGRTAGASGSPTIERPDNRLVLSASGPPGRDGGPLARRPRPGSRAQRAVMKSLTGSGRSTIRTSPIQPKKDCSMIRS